MNYLNDNYYVVTYFETDELQEKAYQNSLSVGGMKIAFNNLCDYGINESLFIHLKNILMFYNPSNFSNTWVRKVKLYKNSEIINQISSKYNIIKE